jgi:arylsulfatase A-like enzyme
VTTGTALLLALTFGCRGSQKQPADTAPDDDTSADAGTDSPSDSGQDTEPRDTEPQDTEPPADSGDTEAGGGDSGDSGLPDGFPLAFVAPPRNLLMITLDTTRRDYVGRYSGDPEATPTMDALMAEGVALDDHHSCSNWTWDAILCVHTATDPYKLFEYIVSENGAPAPFVPGDVDLMSEVVKAWGFQTALISAQAFMANNTGMEEGYDEVHFLPDGTAEEMNAQAWDTLSRIDQSQPWFMNLHYIDPHILYTPPEEYLGGLEGLDPIPYQYDSVATYGEILQDWETLDDAMKELIRAHLEAAYRGELRYFDDQLAVLMAGLDEAGWLDDTLVMFWTDHGEQIWQHGYPDHGGGLYEEEKASVAFFWAKGITPVAWTGPTTHTDLWPTALEALGITLAPKTLIDGVSLGGRPSDAPMYGLRYRGGSTDQSVQIGPAKLLYRWNGEKQFYRLDTDPAETENLYDPESLEVQALWGLLQTKVTEVHAALGGPDPVDAAP